MRDRLPNRRPAVTEPIEFVRSDGTIAAYEATVGFDDAARPKEIFLFGAKEGSDMSAVLADASVAISVALQCGCSAEAMAVSISRVPAELDGPATKPASVIGAALDVLVRWETAPQIDEVTP